MSNFGGPEDMGVSPGEGLALFSPPDLDNPEHAGLFLSAQPSGTTGLARRLDPEAFYVACRWEYEVTPKALLRTVEVSVTNVETGQTLMARPADWGPHVSTGRVADLSPGLEEALGLSTDDLCEVVLIVGEGDGARHLENTVGNRSFATGGSRGGIAVGGLLEPKVFSCDEWGAKPARRTSFAQHRAEGIVIHHTEGGNRAPKGTRSAEEQAAFKTARSIQASHHGRGWADTGQHFTISQGGVIMEGRHGSLAAARNGDVTQGAHAGNRKNNERWFGIEICGNNNRRYHVTQQQWSALVDLCAWLCDARGGEGLEIIGHQEVRDTTCPGLLMEHLAELADAVRSHRHPSGDAPASEKQGLFAKFVNLVRNRRPEISRSSGTRAAARVSQADFIAAKFVWRYHFDPLAQDQFDPQASDWLERMLTVKIGQTLLSSLPGTPAGIAAGRIETAAVFLVGVCLHPQGENANLKPGVTRSGAVGGVIAVLSDKKKSVAKLGGTLQSSFRFTF
jgi:hypothetical protein